jgi:hypothetical protein
MVVIESSPEFESVLVNIMVGPSKKYYCKIMNAVIFLSMSVVVIVT